MVSEDVERMRNVAIVMANVARLNARIEAMKAANARRSDQGFAQAYPEEAFLAVIDEEGLDYNSISLGQLNQRQP